MDLLRGSLHRELRATKIDVSFPEERDARFSHCHSKRSARRPTRAPPIFPAGCWLAEIRRWHTDGRSPLRTLVEMQLVRIDDGAVSWQGRIQKTVPLVGAATIG